MQAGHKYLNAADVSTACAVPRRLFVKFQRQMSRLASQLIPSKTPVLRASPDLSANLLQSKVSYGRHTSFSRASLQPGEGNRRRGGYPTLRQNHPCDAGSLLRCQPFQPRPYHSRPPRTERQYHRQRIHAGRCLRPGVAGEDDLPPGLQPFYLHVLADLHRSFRKEV